MGSCLMRATSNSLRVWGSMPLAPSTSITALSAAASVLRATGSAPHKFSFSSTFGNSGKAWPVAPSTSIAALSAAASVLRSDALTQGANLRMHHQPPAHHPVAEGKQGVNCKVTIESGNVKLCFSPVGVFAEVLVAGGIQKVDLRGEKNLRVYVSALPFGMLNDTLVIHEAVQPKCDSLVVPQITGAIQRLAQLLDCNHMVAVTFYRSRPAAAMTRSPFLTAVGTKQSHANACPPGCRRTQT